MKGTGAKRNVCPGSCVSTGAKFPVAPVESAPMVGGWFSGEKQSLQLALRSTQSMIHEQTAVQLEC